MKTILVVLFLVASQAANAEEPESKWKWTRTDTAFQVATVALMVVDWGQSFDVSASQTTTAHAEWTRADGTKTAGTTTAYDYEEFNPILGPRPTRGTINTYFVAVIVGHTAIARLLPNPYRRVWQCIWIAGESTVVGNNFSGGVRVTF